MCLLLLPHRLLSNFCLLHERLFLLLQGLLTKSIKTFIWFSETFIASSLPGILFHLLFVFFPDILSIFFRVLLIILILRIFISAFVGLFLLLLLIWFLIMRVRMLFTICTTWFGLSYFIVLFFNIFGRKDLICFVNFFKKFLFSCLRVRMIFFSKGPKGFLNLIARCILAQLKDFVIVFFGVKPLNAEEIAYGWSPHSNSFEFIILDLIVVIIIRKEPE